MKERRLQRREKRKDRRNAIKGWIRTNWAVLITLPWELFKAGRNLRQLKKEGASQEMLWAATLVHARHIVAILPLKGDEPVNNQMLIAELSEDIWDTFLSKGDK